MELISKHIFYPIYGNKLIHIYHWYDEKYLRVIAEIDKNVVHVIEFDPDGKILIRYTLEEALINSVHDQVDKDRSIPHIEAEWHDVKKLISQWKLKKNRVYKIQKILNRWS